MKRLIVLASLLSLSCGNRAESTPPPEPAGVAVVELFTSQGCSSCPAADALLSKLSEERSLRGRVIPLSFHVDYWNHIGWTDPFSASEWSARQRSYSAALRDEVYTPQAVINGSLSVVGSSDGAVRSAIEAALGQRPSAQLAVSAMTTPHGTIAIDVKGSQSTRGTLEVWVAIVENDLVTKVGRGENGGRTLENDNVVRALERVTAMPAEGAGAWHVEIKPDRSWKLGNLEVVAFAQNPKSSKIHGAAVTRVPEL